MHPLSAANGTSIWTSGKANVKLTIGKQETDVSCIVANIVHNVVGMDFLMGQDIVIDPYNCRLNYAGERVRFLHPSMLEFSSICKCGGTYFKRKTEEVEEEDITNVINGISASTHLRQSTKSNFYRSEGGVTYWNSNRKTTPNIVNVILPSCICNIAGETPHCKYWERKGNQLMCVEENMLEEYSKVELQVDRPMETVTKSQRKNKSSSLQRQDVIKIDLPGKEEVR